MFNIQYPPGEQRSRDEYWADESIIKVNDGVITTVCVAWWRAEADCTNPSILRHQYDPTNGVITPDPARCPRSDKRGQQSATEWQFP